MKSNFSLKTTKINQELHIHLHGVFDGASAFDLIKVIQEVDDQGLTIFIDTSRLNQALPFGQAILDANLPKNSLRPKLHFSGVWAAEILPKGCTLLNPEAGKTHHCRGNCKNCRCGHNKA